MTKQADSTPNKISHAWVALPLAFLVVGVFRGIRSPNAWSMTHYLLTYEEGPTKRALSGEVFRLLGSELASSYYFWASLSYLVLFFNIGLLILLLIESTRHAHRWYAMASVIFCAGPSLVFLAHTVGYAEQLGLLVTLVTMRISRWFEKYAFTLVACPLLICIHEAHLLLFYPVILFSLMLTMDDPVRQKRWMLGQVLICILTTAVMGNATLSVHEAAQLYEVIQARADFHLRADVFSTLHRTGLDNLRAVWHVRVVQGTWDNLMLSFLALIVPAAYLVLCFYWMTLRRSILWYSGLAVFCAPLGLHVLGWDEMRWNGIALCHLFLVITHVSGSAPNDEQNIPPTWFLSRPFWASVLILVSLMPFPMFDGYTSTQNPVLRAVEYVDELAKGKRLIPGPRDRHRPGYKI